MAQDRSFLTELTRRNVWRVGITYVIGAWLILQVLETVASITGAPDWIAKFLLVALIIGLPVVLLLAWAYEVTPEGIKREKDVDRTISITHQTGARLNKITIGIFIIAVGWIIADRTVLSSGPQSAASPQSVIQEEIVATEIAEKSIAVLPFMNMSEDVSAGHFSDGLADTVLHKLAQIHSLHVVARNSSFQFRGQNVDIRDVGEKLNVATVLEGSVQAAGNQIRVTAQLIDVSNGYHLWSGNFDRELDDVFGIQDQIAEEVVKALQVSLGAEDTARMSKRDTENIEAFREYSLALRAMDEFSFESLPRAIEHLDKAITFDPNYTLAWATKAQALRLMVDLGSYSDTQYEEAAKPILRKVLELDRQYPLARALNAEIEHEAGNRDAAISQIEQAVRLAPNDPAILGIHANILSSELQPRASLDSLLKALELDPMSIPAHQAAVSLLTALERVDEARELGARMRTLNPRAAAGYWASAQIEERNGNWALSIMLNVDAHRMDPSDPITTNDLGRLFFSLGLEDVAEAWYGKSVEIDATHPAAWAAQLATALYEKDLNPAHIKLARKQLIDGVPEHIGARNYALWAILRAAIDSGDFDEYLAWLRHYYPTLFDPNISTLDDVYGGRPHFGYTMVLGGLEEQGRKVLDLSVAHEDRRFDAFGTAPRFGYFRTTAISGDKEKALRLLESLSPAMRLNDVSTIRGALQMPWSEEYKSEPAFQAFTARLEKHAKEQRQLLLEMNGGTYPMPD